MNAELCAYCDDPATTRDHVPSKKLFTPPLPHNLITVPACDRRNSGASDDDELSNERVHRRGNPAAGLTFAQAATRAIALGGTFDGHELPQDIHPVTRASATALAGLGLMGVAKDNYPRDGDTYSFVAGFAEVEVDVETGKTKLIDYLGVGDVGTVVNPRSLMNQILGGSCLGIGHALSQRIVYDPHYGAALARRFHYNKPLTILDIPPELQADAVNIADPETPVGARGTPHAAAAPSGDRPLRQGYRWAGAPGTDRAGRRRRTDVGTVPGRRGPAGFPGALDTRNWGFAVGLQCGAGQCSRAPSGRPPAGGACGASLRPGAVGRRCPWNVPGNQSCPRDSVCAGGDP